MKGTWIVLTVVAVAGAALAAPTQDPLKWSQPPRVIPESEAGNPPLILGWDQISMVQFPIVADDFPCDVEEPVTDLHWWGSFPGFDGSGIPPVQPSGFLIRFWSDVPAGADPDQDVTWSHPGDELHEIVCREYTVEPFGYDIDVEQYQQNNEIIIVDQCFQYNQKLDRPDYFRQKGTAADPLIYWISIQAFWDAGVDPIYDWGWKTKPDPWNDDAVVGNLVQDPGGAQKLFWSEVIGPDGRSWDMAYELTVPEPATMAVLGLGSMLALLRRRRRRR